jgi:CubicO group peptidase (beta-lactamase class C family)
MTTKIISIFSTTGLLVCLLTSCDSNPGKTKSEKIEYIVQEAVDDQQFVGNVLVADSGRIVYKKSYGKASAVSGVLNSDDTKFLIASLSKPFTATLILLLAEQNKIDLHDRITKYFPAVNTAISEITIHHLLTHTSGIREFITEEHAFEDQDLQHTGFNFKPGSDFEYSNSGYVLLKRIAEIVSGQPFSALINQMIFIPLHMTSSGVARDVTGIPGLAAGYKDATQHEAETINYSLEVVDGAGSLFSTAADLLKFSEGIHSEKFLSAPMHNRMFHQHVDEKFGYGWFLRERGGVWNVAYHKGDLPGYTTFLSRKTTANQTIILLCNAGGLDPGDMENDIARVLKAKK